MTNLEALDILGQPEKYYCGKDWMNAMWVIRKTIQPRLNYDGGENENTKLLNIIITNGINVGYFAVAFCLAKQNNDYNLYSHWYDMYSLVKMTKEDFDYVVNGIKIYKK